MKTKTKKLLLLSCLTALIGTMGVASMSAVDASATTGGVAPTSFALENAASIRTKSPYGIRFTANISADDYDKLTKVQGSEVEFGMLICPSDYVTADNPLDMDSKTGTMTEYESGSANIANTYQKKQVEKLVEVRNENNELIGYNYSGSLTGIQENNLSRPFTAVGYIEYKASAEATPVVYYTAPVSRAIYSVATYAAVDTAANYSSDMLTFLNGIITDVQAVYNQVEVSIESDGADFEYNMFSVGDEFTLGATVSNGTRTLETNPAIVTGDLLEKVDGKKNTYEVKGLGNLNLTVKVGENSEKPLTDTSLNATDALYYSAIRNIGLDELTPAYSGAEKAFDFAVTQDVIGGVSGAIQIGVTNEEGLARFGVPAGIANTIKKGDRLVFDVFSPDDPNLSSEGPSIYMQTIFDGGQNSSGEVDIAGAAIGEKAGFFKWRTFTTEEVAWDRAPVLSENRWLRMEIEFLRDVNMKDGDRLALYFYPSNYRPFPYYMNNLHIQTYACGYESAEVLGYDENKTYAYGEEVAITANVIDYVGRPKAVTPTLAIASGTATVTNGKVKMAFGDSMVSVDAGVGDPLTVTLKGSTTMNVFNSQETQSNIIYASSPNFSDAATVGGEKNANNTISEVTYKESFMGMSNVLELYTKANGSAYIQFIGDAQAVATSGNYVYMDVFVPDALSNPAYPAYFGYGGGSVHYFTTAASADSATQWYQFYNADGTPTTDNLHTKYDMRNKWLHIGFRLDRDFTGAWNYLGLMECDREQYMYIANIVVSSEKMTTVKPGETSSNISLELNQRNLLSYTGNGNIVNVGTVTDSVGVARANAYSWTMTGVGHDSRLVFSDVVRKNFTATTGCYITFDIYVQGLASPTLNAYGSVQDIYSTGPVGTGTNVKWQFYDANGNAYTESSANFWNGSGPLMGKWVTIELQWTHDMYPIHGSMTQWESIECSSPYGYATEDKPIYLANMTVSNVSRMAK